MTRRMRAARLGLLLAALATIAAACGSSSSKTTKTAAPSSTASAKTASCNSPGVTPTTITVGELGPLAGPVAPSFASIFAGFQARIDELNAAGGIDGRKVVIVSANDGGLDPTQNLTAAKELVEQQHVFAVMEATDIDEGSGAYLNQAGVPVVGYNVSNTWGMYPNMFGYSGSNSPKPEPKTTDGLFLKSQGVTKLAIVGINNPASVTAAQEEAASAKAEGVDVVLDNTSGTVTTSVWTAQAQQVAASGAQAVYAPVTSYQSFPLYAAIQQAGAHLKFMLFPQGYGLDVAKQIGPGANGAVFSIDFVPFGSPLGGPGQSEALAAFKKYVPNVPVTDQLVDGYLSGDMLIKGLEVAGSCPTQSAFITNLRNVTHYTAGGFFNPPLDLKTTFGQPYGLCFHYVKIVNGQLVNLNNGAAICGKPLPASSS
jgi:branched-chain amino acid transport system substrate-binding protein